jgi:hypothetical protein
VCGDQSCCSQVQACAADPTCTSIAQNSATLAAAAQAAQQAGNVPGENLATCLENNCATPCGG